MGHSIKEQSVQIGKTKEKIIYIAKKSPRWNPHLIEKEIKDYTKKRPMASNLNEMNS